MSRTLQRALFLSDKTNSFWPPATSRNFCRPTVNLKPVAAAALNFNSSLAIITPIFFWALVKINCIVMVCVSRGEKQDVHNFTLQARPMGPGRIARLNRLRPTLGPLNFRPCSLCTCFNKENEQNSRGAPLYAGQ